MINGHEPVAVRTAIVAAVAAVVHVLVLLKVIDLEAGTEAALVTAIDLIAGLAIILLVRPKVTPVDYPVLTVDQVAKGAIYVPEDSKYEMPFPGDSHVPGSLVIQPKVM